MFKNIMDFSFKRSGLQALGWYLFWFLVIILCAGIVGAMIGFIMGEQGNMRVMAMKAGAIIAMIIVTILIILILKNKELLKDPKWILLGLVGIIASLFGGALIGLIIPAVMTMQPRPKKHKVSHEVA